MTLVLSPLDNYRPEITAMRKSGLTNSQMATKIADQFGIVTSEASIRRAFKRWQNGQPVVTDSGEPVQQWGMGMAKLVAPATTETSEIVFFMSDIHVPFQDVALVQSVIELIKEIHPHRVVLNGDVADFFQLSHFNTGKKRLDDLQWEIDMANEVRRQVREAAPDAIIDETEGNHDNRILSYIEKNARALESLRDLKPENLFKYNELEINWHPGCGFLLRPEFLVKHGTAVREEAGASAKAELMKAGISGISGHVHRLATYRKAGYVQRQWTEQGGLMRLDPDYIAGGVPNWQQGIALGEFSNKSNAFVIHEVPTMDGVLAPIHLLVRV